MSISNKSLGSENVFSDRRYFINNLDSYHGAYMLKEVSKVIEQLQQDSKEPETIVVVAEDAVPPSPPPPTIPYEIIGTVIDPNIKLPENVTRIVPRNEVIPQMLTCGTVILDISYDREELRVAMEYMAVLKSLLETLKPKTTDDDDDNAGNTPRPDVTKRYLILISTVMTWSSTRPLDPENPEMPFVETDFRKRKPHPNYRMHYDVENEVVLIARKYRSLIGAIVVNTGVTYGGKEDVLFYWFQKAWECEPLLPILGRGTNAVPLINVGDLAKIVYHLITEFPKKLYILAVEQTVSKQKQIIKSIGRTVGSGMFKCIPNDDAFLIPEIDQRIFDLMTINLNMEPTFIVENMGLQWISEAPFPENVPVLIKHFRRDRGLKSFKVVVYGPPLVGKTTLANQVAKQYGLIYISPETAADDVMEDLAWRVDHWMKGEMAALTPFINPEEETPVDEDEDLADEEAVQEAAKQTLALLQSGRSLTDEEINGYIRQRMLSREALNRGWVLDGFPTSLQECEILFGKGEEQDDEIENEEPHEAFDEDADLYNSVLKKLLPDVVVSLEATDDFVCEKAMRQPEGDPRFDERVVFTNLTKFRAGDHRDITPLNFYDELDIHPLVVHIQDHTDYEMKHAYAEVSLRLGRPCNYGKLLALIEAADKQQQKEIEDTRKKELKALQELERKLAHEREEKMEYWTELYAILRDEEEAALAVAGEPMRNYLVKHIFPTLTPALLEVAKIRPEDPVDFLGEHLFRVNPVTRKFDAQAAVLTKKMTGIPGDLTKPESTLNDHDLTNLNYNELREQIVRRLGKAIEGDLKELKRSSSYTCKDK